MTKEQAREAMDKARAERDAAIAIYSKNATDKNSTAVDEAQQKYIAARDYYTAKFPRHV